MTKPTLDQLTSLPDNALADKVILITGAGAGIGRAAAIDFATAGAHVVLIGRDQSKLESVYDEIEANTQTRPIIFPYDLNTLNPDIAREMAFAIEQEFGRLDGILFNASLLGSKMAIGQYPEQEWLDRPVLDRAEPGEVELVDPDIGHVLVVAGTTAG